MKASAASCRQVMETPARKSKKSIMMVLPSIFFDVIIYEMSIYSRFLSFSSAVLAFPVMHIDRAATFLASPAFDLFFDEFADAVFLDIL